MTQDDRMETITDPEQIRAVWEAGDMGEESLGGDSESGTYNRSNRPPAGPRPDVDNPWALLPDDHPKRPKQCGGCGTTYSAWVWSWRRRARAAEAEVRRLTEENERLKRGGMAEVRQAADALIAAVRSRSTSARAAARAEVERLHEEVHAGNVRGDSLNAALEEAQLAVRQLCARAEAAEAEVVTLRARLAAVEETLHVADATSEFLAASGDTHDAAMAGAVFAVTDNVRAALATTGEGK